MMRLLGLISKKKKKKASVGKVSVKRCCCSISQESQSVSALEVKENKAAVFSFLSFVSAESGFAMIFRVHGSPLCVFLHQQY